MIYFKSCPRCNTGDIHADDDEYRMFLLQCLQCGFNKYPSKEMFEKIVAKSKAPVKTS